ncbi:glycoside hydrolase [Streptomyces sp. G-G2]|uniref:glycoside hydrolase family 38 N-terminal domain-containing protein n=1 Tax=Streptomyces sp. G-G2 TaxID=3046201 RepID=UPI0024B94149|nr:glycoside hydrolase [Streptomyces sp. G-G2]MDJ0381898.1 glycoside hydrolase [Streptomyces sp. G-G2]
MDSGISVVSVTTPALFAGPPDDPLQVVRIRIRRTRSAGPLYVAVSGPGLLTPHPRILRADSPEPGAAAEPGADDDAAAGSGDAADSGASVDPVEVAVRTPGAAPGDRLAATVTVSTPGGHPLAAYPFELTVAEPGWTVRLVPHFHYDPMWWNTQAAYTALWDAPRPPGAPEPGWEYTGVPAFTLIPLHLQQAREDPAYAFVLSEVDYLKPWWDSHPGERAELLALIAAGRVEIVGGTYNEPSTNLTSAEATIRSAVHGLALHRGTLGADPRTAWHLDVFGHDPSFPALMAGAGLDSAVLARGPHHQWGPMMDTWGEALRAPDAMQLPAEYEWIAPSGEGLLLHYLPAHYSAGWFSERAPDAESAAEQLLALYELLRRGAATRNVLIPMGTDFSWPHRWGLEVQHTWNRRYCWPRMEHSGPRAHFAAVRAELAARGERPLPVTREMGPVYTGKDVSYADVKQAHRAAENLVEEAETFAALACAEGLTDYPRRTLDKAWRHILHAAHHDAVTGTFSDQVYLDLLPAWREAQDLAEGVRADALRALTAAADTRVPDQDRVPDRDRGASPAVPAPARLAVTVHNPLSWARTDLVRTTVDLAALGLDEPGAAPGARGGDPRRIVLYDAEGRGSAVHLEAVADTTAEVVFLAEDVPPLGHRTWWLAASQLAVSGGWARGPGFVIENEAFRAEADPERGGGLARLRDRRTGRELLTPGEVDELVVQDEYDHHPYFGEGPWHLLPKGPGTGSGAAPATECHIERGPLGARIVARGRTGPVRWTRTTTLWDGLDRIELTTRVDEFDGSDQLLRLRVPADVPGALPVAETAASAVGRGFAFPGADAGADHTRAPWTLDSPCLNWFALSSTLRAVLTGPDGAPAGQRALGAAEIVLLDAGAPDGLRELVTALGRRGVTATPTRPGGPRWGDLASDSSLPDVRIALGGPGRNAFTARVLAACDPLYAEAVAHHPLVWIPARAALREAWQPGCDLTGPRDLPVLVVTDGAAGLAGALEGTGRIEARHPLPAEGAAEHHAFEDRTVALLTRGTPGFAVDTSGRLHGSLMRSCTGRPSGAWMDPPRRTAPDGSSFQLQHWTHVFEHALIAADGDWRAADLVRRGREFNKPLTAVTTAPGPGPRPSARSLLRVEPADRVLVETVKRASGTDGLAVRLRETHGRPARARLLRPAGPAPAADPEAGLAPVSAQEADLLDRPLGPFGGRIGAAATTTALLAAPSGMPERTGEREPHQPVFSRYWLHNTGTAPLGDAPYTVTVDGPPRAARVTVAAHGAGGDVRLEVHAPHGWRTSWAVHDTVLARAGHERLPLTVTPGPAAEPGEHLVRVLARTPAGDFEDALTVTVPEPGSGGAVPAGLWVDAPGPEVRVTAGGLGVVRAVIGSTGIRSTLTGLAHLVSPHGTRQLIGPAVLPLRVPDGAPAELEFEVHPPLGTAPGTYWAVVKAVCQGRIAYGPAIALRVAGSPRVPPVPPAPHVPEG